MSDGAAPPPDAALEEMKRVLLGSGLDKEACDKALVEFILRRSLAAYAPPTASPASQTETGALGSHSAGALQAADSGAEDDDLMFGSPVVFGTSLSVKDQAENIKAAHTLVIAALKTTDMPSEADFTAKATKMMTKGRCFLVGKGGGKYGCSAQVALNWIVSAHKTKLQKVCFELWLRKQRPMS